MIVFVTTVLAFVNNDAVLAKKFPAVIFHFAAALMTNLPGKTFFSRFKELAFIAPSSFENIFSKATIQSGTIIAIPLHDLFPIMLAVLLYFFNSSGELFFGSC